MEVVYDLSYDRIEPDYIQLAPRTIKLKKCFAALFFRVTDYATYSL